MDQFHSLDNLKNKFASVAFCRNSEAYNVRNGAVIEFPVVVSIGGFPSLLIGGGGLFSTMLTCCIPTPLPVERESDLPAGGFVDRPRQSDGTAGKMTEKLAGGPQAGRSDSPTSKGVGRQQQH